MYQKHKEKQLDLPDLLAGLQSYISCLEQHGMGRCAEVRLWHDVFRHQNWSLELERGQHPLCCSRALAHCQDGVCCTLQCMPNKQPTLVTALPLPSH